MSLVSIWECHWSFHANRPQWESWWVSLRAWTVLWPYAFWLQSNKHWKLTLNVWTENYFLVIESQLLRYLFNQSRNGNFHQRLFEKSWRCKSYTLTSRISQSWALRQISRLIWFLELRKKLKCKTINISGSKGKISIAKLVNKREKSQITRSYKGDKTRVEGRF